MTPVTASEFAALEGVDDWRYTLGSIQAEYSFRSYTAAAAFVTDVAAAADAADHHPDVALRGSARVRLALRTHDAGSLTMLDVEMARQITRIAVEHAAIASPGRIQALEIAIDTIDADRIRGFWAAALGYTATSDGSLADPRRLGPPLWFQQMDAPRTERQRFHLDITVPHDGAEARVAAVLAAGGRLVSAEHARSWWVLADADGNEACICTWQDRD